LSALYGQAQIVDGRKPVELLGEVDGFDHGERAGINTIIYLWRLDGDR
jgi:hypothetical protein